MTDQEILEHLFSRQPQALRELDSRYGAYCLAVARNILGSDEEAREILNDTWMQAWCAIPPARPGNLKLYLAKVARNLALNRLLSQQAQKRRGGIRVQLDELSQVIPADLPDLADRQHLHDCLNRFLGALPREHRQIFLRRYWYGDAIDELAQRFRCSEGRIWGILSRTREKLKKHLEKEELYP